MSGTVPQEKRPVAHQGRMKRLLGVLVLAVVIAAAAVAVYRDRHDVANTFKKIGVWPLLGSTLLAMVGTGFSYPLWRSVLAGLGVDLPFWPGARVFFVSQLGKYLPGSVWPVVMQMEAGRSRGANRRTMLGANLLTIVLSCSVGLILAGALLPFYARSALAHYWWALAALVPLLALLHPRALPFLLDKCFAILRRPGLGERLNGRSELEAVGFSLLSWIALGAHLAVLCVVLGHGGLSTVLLCIGAVGLAIPAGILFIPAPAGAGVRDIVLKLVLGTLLAPSQALALVVASRVIFICGDCLLALFAVGAVAVVRLRRAFA